MNPSTKMLMVSGYTIVAGLVLSISDYIPVNIMGNMMCGAGFVVMISALNQAVKEALSSKSE